MKRPNFDPPCFNMLAGRRTRQGKAPFQQQDCPSCRHAHTTHACTLIPMVLVVFQGTCTQLAAISQNTINQYPPNGHRRLRCTSHPCKPIIPVFLPPSRQISLPGQRHRAAVRLFGIDWEDMICLVGVRYTKRGDAG